MFIVEGDKMKKVEIGGACGNHRRDDTCRILFSNFEGVRQLGRPKRWWKDNIKINLKEIRYEEVDWIHVAQDWDLWQAAANTVMSISSS